MRRGEMEAVEVSVVGALTADATARAILRAVRTARSLGKLPAYAEPIPSVRHAFGRNPATQKSRNGADLLIFDAQYSFAEAELVKRDRGHSSNIIGVELSVLSGARHFVLFHTDPNLDDDRLDQITLETRSYGRIYAEDYPLQVSMAYDGLEIEV